MTDVHIGTLLSNLQEMRHPTKLESRLLQMQDEYSLLQDSTILNTSDSKADMKEFVEKLKMQLDMNKVYINEPIATESDSEFGLFAIKQKIDELYQNLLSKNQKKVSKALSTLDSLIISDSSADILCKLGIVEKAINIISTSSHDSSHMREWLRLLSCLTAFNSFRTDPLCWDVMELSIKLLSSKNVPVVELAIWILANLSVESSKQVEIGKLTILTLIDLLQDPQTDAILQHTLRCVTNLCSQRANRKVLDAWGGFDAIATALRSDMPEIQIQSVWCISNLSVKETSELFQNRDDIIEKLLEFVQSASLALETASWRCISNLSLLKHPRQLILQHDIFNTLESCIITETEEFFENTDKDLAPLLEAIGCLSNLVLKEKNLMEQVSQELVLNLVKLLGSYMDTVRHQAMWCLAYISSNELNHSKIILNGGLEIIIDSLEEEDDDLRLPAIWVITNLASNHENSDRIREVDGIHILVKILFRSKEDIRLVTGKALSHLAKNTKNKTLLKNLFSKLSQIDDSEEKLVKN